MADRVKVSFEDRSLPCVLTAAERERKGEEMAKTVEEIDRLESQRKAAAESYKGQVTVAEGRLRSLGRVISQGHEYREVRCRRMLEYTEQRLSVVREDTGEVVEERPLNEKELREFEAAAQGSLFGDQTPRIGLAEDGDGEQPKDEETEAQPGDEKASEPAPASPHVPDAREPGYEAPPAAVCETCKHVETVHGGTGFRGCMAIGCTCKRFRAPLADPDPLGLEEAGHATP